MIEANDINKIRVNSPLTVNSYGIVPLLFVDQLQQSRSTFSIVDNLLNLVNQAQTNISLYVDASNTTKYWEYSLPLRTDGMKIYGVDINGNSLSGLSTSQPMVFINGYKLKEDEFEIEDDSHLIIKISFPEKNYSNVSIYASQNLVYMGQPIMRRSKGKLVSTILGYSPDKLMFFKNGYNIPSTYITSVGSEVTFNISFNEDVDYIEYYQLPTDTVNYYFDAILGIYSYGPTDFYNRTLPVLYDTIITFTDAARLLIDDLRPGFFVKEDENVGTGILEIIDTNYETCNLKCLCLQKFSKEQYATDEYFLQVPDARSILHYISDYDLRGTLFPEILGSFQKLLMNETYDSLLRLRNIRSIENVNSKDIVKLLRMLGNGVNVTDSSLLHKHNLLEETNNYNRSIGTRNSYHYYNFSTSVGDIIKIDQLYTPIKDMVLSGEDVFRYVTFKTAEELGAVEKKEYRFPYTDYGQVNVLANPEDSYSNSTTEHTRSPGILEDPERGKIQNRDPAEYKYAIMEDKWDVYKNNEDGTTTLHILDIVPNRYVSSPVQGPNKPTEGYDYGSVTEEAVNFYDYGSVEEKIQGRWVTWYEWDRPAEWYPTNHVNVLVNVPATMDHDTFMTHFTNSLYEIASAVLYVHSTVETYSIARDNRWEQGDDIQYGIMVAPTYQTETFVLSNDPKRQIFAR